MIRLLTLIAAVLIGLHLDPFGPPLERVAFLGAFLLAFVQLVLLLARQDVNP